MKHYRNPIPFYFSEMFLEKKTFIIVSLRINAYMRNCLSRTFFLLSIHSNLWRIVDVSPSCRHINETICLLRIIEIDKNIRRFAPDVWSFYKIPLMALTIRDDLDFSQATFKRFFYHFEFELLCAHLPTRLRLNWIVSMVRSCCCAFRQNQTIHAKRRCFIDKNLILGLNKTKRNIFMALQRC